MEKDPTKTTLCFKPARARGDVLETNRHWSCCYALIYEALSDLGDRPKRARKEGLIMVVINNSSWAI